MGKHSGTQDPNDLAGPSGPGPHPTPKQSEEAGKKFDAQFSANAKKRRSSDR
jgi:hypothetical protein